MKSFVAGLVFALSLGYALAASSPVGLNKKEEQAFIECNATNPVTRNPVSALGLSINTGERVKLTPEEKCFIFCLLQKVKLLNENADIYNGPGLVNYTIHSIPRLGKYADEVAVAVYQSNKTGKGFDEKCQKAVVVFHQYAYSINGIIIADALNKETSLREKVVKAMETGKPLDEEVTKHVENFLEDFSAISETIAKQLDKQSQAPSGH